MHGLEIQVVLETFALQIGYSVTAPPKIGMIPPTKVVSIEKWIILILVEVYIIVD